MMNPAIALSVARIGIGAAALVKPDAAFQGLMLDPKRNPQQQFVTRMFGSREIALGVATLASIRSGSKTWLLAGVAIDAADAVAGYLSGQSGAVERSKSSVLMGLSASAVASGVLGLRGVSKPAAIEA
ncbi:MAG TPA: DUF4267 domain-containing protein [Nocardioidaceae bacterium]|nr:DUF4267 domain-containing protein [Nocardioidaceae bacterium]